MGVRDLLFQTMGAMAAAGSGCCDEACSTLKVLVVYCADLISVELGERIRADTRIILFKLADR